MSLEIILNIEPLDIHIKKLVLTAYKCLEHKLDQSTGVQTQPSHTYNTGHKTYTWL